MGRTVGGDLRVCVRGFRFYKFRVLHHNGYFRITCTAKERGGEKRRDETKMGERRDERRKKYACEIAILSTQYSVQYDPFPIMPSPHHRTVVDISAPHDRPTVVNGHHFSVDINHFRHGGAVKNRVVAEAEERDKLFDLLIRHPLPPQLMKHAVHATCGRG